MAADAKSMEERNQILAQQVQMEIARGGRVESQSDAMAVIVHGRRVNHLLHFIIGILTLGFWWFVWIALALLGGEKRWLITVDERGNMSRQRA